jgi:hypothetical protein
MKRSATPLPSGSRTKDGEASMPKHLISSLKSPDMLRLKKRYISQILHYSVSPVMTRSSKRKLSGIDGVAEGVEHVGAEAPAHHRR